MMIVCAPIYYYSLLTNSRQWFGLYRKWIAHIFKIHRIQLTLHNTVLSLKCVRVTKIRFSMPSATHKFRRIFEGLSFLNFLQKKKHIINTVNSTAMKHRKQSALLRSPLSTKNKGPHDKARKHHYGSTILLCASVK